MFDGEILEDGRTLADYNIQKEDTLTLRMTELEPQKDGWVEENGQKYYLKDGVKLTDWHNDIPGWEEKWFCFDRNTGALQTGWHNDIPGWEGKWFYFDLNTGVMFTDWHSDIPGWEGKWLCFDRVTGVMRTGWHNNIPGWEGKWFYFDLNTGVMFTDWHDDIPYYEGQWFCFDRVTGVMRTGWHANIPGWEGQWFYFDLNTGVMQTGWHNDIPGWEGQWIYLDPDTGVLQNDWMLDNAAPVISGVEDGKTYCEAQTVTVDEKYTDSVTVNGTAVTLDANNRFTLNPADGTQTIVVTDKADNETSVTVTVNNGHTGGEATCVELAICDTCGEHYGELDSTNHNLEKIPAKDATVTKTGNEEYWHCEDCGKYFADENGENEIELADTVIAKLQPEIIEGTGQSVTEGEKKELTFRSNAAYSDFIRAQLDGKTLDEKNYTVKEGSTVVTLKADYVATLSAGEHTIVIVSESGTATTTFTVNAKAENNNNSPQTGDNSMILLWVALFFVSGLGTVIATVYSKKRSSAK